MKKSSRKKALVKKALKKALVLTLCPFIISKSIEAPAFKNKPIVATNNKVECNVTSNSVVNVLLNL